MATKCDVSGVMALYREYTSRRNRPSDDNFFKCMDVNFQRDFQTRLLFYAQDPQYAQKIGAAANGKYWYEHWTATRFFEMSSLIFGISLGDHHLQPKFMSMEAQIPLAFGKVLLFPTPDSLSEFREKFDAFATQHGHPTMAERDAQGLLRTPGARNRRSDEVRQTHFEIAKTIILLL